MGSICKVVIGIQARSSSKRLPGKVFKKIGRNTMLDEVIEKCSGAAHYLNLHGDTKRRITQVVLAVPFDDPIKKAYAGEIDIVEGPEDDVLGRYMNLAHQYNPDYIVRVTSDCPLIPQFVISKCITVALMNGYDYLSNVDERCRTSPDGWDCEVFSQRLLAHAYENATDKSDREHVTTYMRKNLVPGMRQGTVINHMDQSHIKISVDTEEDLERVRGEFEKVQAKRLIAEGYYGKKNVHSV